VLLEQWMIYYHFYWLHCSLKTNASLSCTVSISREALTGSSTKTRELVESITLLRMGHPVDRSKIEELIEALKNEAQPRDPMQMRRLVDKLRGER